ncbi:MAG: hypothetical protein H0T45_13550 [Pyrinomonadaceae bacterium]|nr:hypothetical protein [Pyrinomonadaceae bacterium]MDQ3134723.1 hypothetical protein [Acidobacteriota bacterium]
MNFIKLILLAVVLILAAMLAFAAIGVIFTALQYLFWLGVIIIAGAVAYKLLKKPSPPQLETGDPFLTLENAERTLEEYKRKQLSK